MPLFGELIWLHLTWILCPETQRLFVYLLCEEEVRMHALPAPRRSEAEVSDERGLAYEIHSQKYTYFTVFTRIYDLPLARS